MVFPDRAWPTCAPEEQGIDGARLADALGYARGFCGTDGVRGCMVIRNGHCVWQGDEVDREHDIYSCTKSVTGTVFGLMLEAGLCRLDTRAADYLGALERDYPHVTLGHLASMTSGYNSVGGKYGVDNASDGSLTPWLPREPVFTRPGSFFHYHDNAFRLFGWILQAILGKSLAEYFRETIAEPIGIKRWYWSDYLGNGMGSDPASSLYMAANEFAKLGHLHLNNGMWNGERVLPEQWIRTSTTSQTLGVPDYSGPVYRGIPGGGFYGYTWWANAGNGMDRDIPSLPDGMYNASGYNNNHLWVIPEWDMVIVRLGVDGSVDKGMWRGFFDRFRECVMH